jgi:hypothetical protein
MSSSHPDDQIATCQAIRSNERLVMGEILPDLSGSGERQFTLDPAVGKKVVGSGFVTRSIAWQGSSW